jgi:hypothetical protein
VICWRKNGAIHEREKHPPKNKMYKLNKETDSKKLDVKCVAKEKRIVPQTAMRPPLGIIVLAILTALLIMCFFIWAMYWMH